MSDTHTNGSQFITETGASSTGNGDGECKKFAVNGRAVNSSESGDSRASKSRFLLEWSWCLRDKHQVVSWVRKYWKAKMEAQGMNDKGRKTSKILLKGAEADKCGEVLLVRLRTGQSRRVRVPLAPTLPRVRPVHTLNASPTVGKGLFRRGRVTSQVSPGKGAGWER